MPGTQVERSGSASVATDVSRETPGGALRPATCLGECADSGPHACLPVLAVFLRSTREGATFHAALRSAPALLLRGCRWASPIAHVGRRRSLGPRGNVSRETSVHPCAATSALGQKSMRAFQRRRLSSACSSPPPTEPPRHYTPSTSGTLPSHRRLRVEPPIPRRSDLSQTQTLPHPSDHVPASHQWCTARRRASQRATHRARPSSDASTCTERRALAPSTTHRARAANAFPGTRAGRQLHLTPRQAPSASLAPRQAPVHQGPVRKAPCTQAPSAKRRASCAKRQAPCVVRQAPSAKRRASCAKRRAPSAVRKALRKAPFSSYNFRAARTSST